jgi:glucosamine 6-phosphate synthetase-like amidotransferase/phosphosugar isomerase protein
VVYVVSTVPLAAVASQAASALVELGVRTAAVEAGHCAVPDANHRLTLPDVPEWLSPLILAIPMQILAYHLARATGLDPDTRSHLRDDSVRFRVSRMLTRRSLLGTGQ